LRTASSGAARLFGAALFGFIGPCIAVVGSSGREIPGRISFDDQGRHAPMVLHERHGRNATSFNWSGYAVTGPNDSVSDVKGSWKVPAIQGACSSQTQYSSFWVGIDGYSSNTVEQIGTDSDCQNGSPIYYAWYEFYPHYPYNIRIAISAGDVISAEVSYLGGKFTVSITDVTTQKSWNTSEKMPNAKRASAEWIIEDSGGMLPDFGTVDLGQHYTRVPLTCDATVSGASGPIGSAAFAARLVEITMVASDGTIMSQPSSLSKDETSFTDTWMNAGP